MQPKRTESAAQVHLRMSSQPDAFPGQSTYWCQRNNAELRVKQFLKQLNAAGCKPIEMKKLQLSAILLLSNLSLMAKKWEVGIPFLQHDVLGNYG